MGPLLLSAWGSGGILAPGETCMLASWAAYSCCRAEQRKEGGVSVEELGQTLRVLYSVLPSVCPPTPALPLSFASPLPRLPTFHEVGREPPSKVLTVFQRQDPERDSSLKKPHRDGFLSKILGAPVFHSSQRKSLPNWMRVCWSRFFSSLHLDLHGFLLKCSFFLSCHFFSFLLCPVMCLQRVPCECPILQRRRPTKPQMDCPPRCTLLKTNRAEA